jgi:hypothetical protein
MVDELLLDGIFVYFLCVQRAAGRCEGVAFSWLHGSMAFQALERSQLRKWHGKRARDSSKRTSIQENELWMGISTRRTSVLGSNKQWPIFAFVT